jgi:hypothetical protein
MAISSKAMITVLLLGLVGGITDYLIDLNKIQFAKGQGAPFQTAADQQKQKQKQLQHQQGSSSCWRQCPQGRNNKIVYNFDNAAGLGDRETVISVLTELAGYLCANVEFPRPAFSLRNFHNGGSPTSFRAVWNDYFIFTFQQDGTPSLVELDNNPTTTMNTTKPNALEIYAPGTLPENWTLLVTNDRKQVVDHFLQTEALSFRQPAENFIWIWNSYFYRNFEELKSKLLVTSGPTTTRADSWRMSPLPPLETFPKQLLADPTKGCSYTNRRSPLYVQEMAQGIWNHIQTLGKPQSIFGFLRIRRGDQINSCNTTLERMKSYIQCSFNGTSSTPMTLMLLSDEQDSEYRRGIQRLVEDLGHVTFIDLDDVVYKYLERAVKNNQLEEYYLDNYHVFLMEKEIRKWTVFRITQTRTNDYWYSCNDCDAFVGRKDLWT